MRVRFWRILAMVGCAVLVFAVRSYAVPKLMNFQGKLFNSAGTPLSGTYSVKFSIYNVSSGGSALWTETRSISISAGDKGIYNVLLGGVNPININFNGDYWLGIKVGGDTEMTPRFRLATVPFAFRADFADKAADMDKWYYYNSAGVLQGTIKAASWSNSGVGFSAMGDFPENLLNPAGDSIPWSHSIGFSIYNVFSGGSALWTETQLISSSSIRPVLLGSVNPINIKFNGDYWLGIKVGSAPEKRFRLAAVPLALRADIADRLYSYDSAGVLQGTIRAASFLSPEGLLSGIGYTSPYHLFFNNSGTILASFGMSGGKPSAWFPNNLSVGGQLKGSNIESSGNLQVNGNLQVGGVKNFVQPYPGDPTKEIVYTSLEGPEAGTYCRGRGKLENGIAVIQLPDTFPLVTSAEAIITTQATPRGDCRGLYVAEASPTQIIIKELQGGKSNVEFDYLVQGVRKGYEHNPVIRERTKTKALPGKPPEAK